MIASISGRISEKFKDSAVILVNGVGFQVFVPAPLLDQLRPGENTRLYTQLVVRQDSLTLYGFENVESRELFEILIGVSGIGPRLALSMLSTLEPETIERAVFNEQAEVFSRVPGIGTKTSRKILLHLQDKIPSIERLKPMVVISDVDAEVVGALTALGYSVVEAQAALQAIPKDAPQDVEVRLRIALQYYSK
ncbi:MAG: Holliday junction branch migration protein RuvA [Anaerolineales bacterium]|jgi:Holliday junction DNA helicase RuvA|nr:Holliday junction branch migration protein RuvA [Anaerolineales bacterium]